MTGTDPRPGKQVLVRKFLLKTVLNMNLCGRRCKEIHESQAVKKDTAIAIYSQGELFLQLESRNRN